MKNITNESGPLLNRERDKTNGYLVRIQAMGLRADVFINGKRLGYGWLLDEQALESFPWQEQWQDTPCQYVGYLFPTWMTLIGFLEKYRKFAEVCEMRGTVGTTRAINLGEALELELKHLRKRAGGPRIFNPMREN